MQARQQMEQWLATHGAAVLAGLKVSNLFTIDEKCCKAWPCVLMQAIKDLQEPELTAHCLRHQGGRITVLLYARRQMQAIWENPAHQAFLAPYGYRPEMRLHEVFTQLRKRMQESAAFPHEIGIFLGYPLEDVQGYIAHRGQASKLVGHWKVYGNPQKARGLFERYHFACRHLTDALAQGSCLPEALRGLKQQVGMA